MATADESKKLIDRTTDLRDELLIGTAKLDQYVESLQTEIARLRKLAEDRRQREDEES